MTTEHASLTVAALQMCSSQDVERNLARCEALVHKAQSAGARFVGLPENFAYLGASRDHKKEIAESLNGPPGPILRRMKNLAQSLNIYILLGGFPEKNDDRNQVIFNTSVLLSPTGAIVARYRKIHLFDVDVPGGRAFRESDDVSPGKEVVVADVDGICAGLSVCYDLRFPELYRQLTDRGARIVTAPSAFTRETGSDHWHVLLRARAIENQIFVVAPAQWGRHGDRRASYGHAAIVDPWGCVLSECGNHEGIALATLDFSHQDLVRSKLPVLQHRRL